jgi:hypothetical protein
MHTEWEAWYTEGRRFDSSTARWEDLPSVGVLVVRAWFPGGAMTVNWDDGYYGHPDTWKAAGWVSNQEFASEHADAQRTTDPPSKGRP